MEEITLEASVKGEKILKERFHDKLFPEVEFAAPTAKTKSLIVCPRLTSMEGVFWEGRKTALYNVVEYSKRKVLEGGYRYFLTFKIVK